MIRGIFAAALLVVFIAQTVAAQNYQKGLEAAQRGDFVTALREWTPLAEQGDAAAQWGLGVVFEHGKGIPKDYAEAMKWYLMAAEQGYTLAMLNLSNMYAGGYGVGQDYVRSHMWANLAATHGQQHATKNRDHIAKKMTPSQIAKAQRLARECTKRNYKRCD
jgi:uncharacterized protein